MLPNISKSKGNQTMKFALFIGYTQKYTKSKSCKKSDGGTSPRPFSKKSKLNISLDQQSEYLYSLFLLPVQVEDYQNILKLGW